jgi:hypothetical protein
MISVMGYFSKLIKRAPTMDVVDSLLVKSDMMLLGFVEEMRSLVLQAEKVKLIRENGCAGVAEWKLGLETSDVWAVIADNLAG